MGKEFIRSFCSYRLSEIIPNLDANALYEFTIMLTESQGRGITATMDTATVAVSAPGAASNAAILASGTKYIKYYYRGSHLTTLAGSGNSVNLTIEIKALQGFGANGVIVSDISVNAVSFGVNTPIALRNGAAYRYGFNGMERDDEVKGSGNSYSTYFRQYDPRLGRWFSVEPKPVAWESPYAAFRNNPIRYSDPRGDCPDGNCDDVVDSPTISDDNGGKNNNRVGSSRGHKGIDIIAPKGAAINAVMGGKVTVINNHNSDEYSGRRRSGVSKSPTTGLGNTVIVETTLESDYTYLRANGKEYSVQKGETVFIKYSHLDIGIANLNGETVKAGDQIGVAGATGNAGLYNGQWGIEPSKRHVHIEARVGDPFGRAIDPEGFFKTKFDSNGDAIPNSDINSSTLPIDDSLEGY